MADQSTTTTITPTTTVAGDNRYTPEAIRGIGLVQSVTSIFRATIKAIGLMERTVDIAHDGLDIVEDGIRFTRDSMSNMD